MWYIGATICVFNNKLQKKIQKFFHMKKRKGLKKGSQSSCKVIPLAPLNVFLP
jgi:hypothetical protein